MGKPELGPHEFQKMSSTRIELGMVQNKPDQKKQHKDLLKEGERTLSI